MRAYRGKQRYSSTNSLAQNGDKWLSYPREGTPAPAEDWAGWATEAVWMFWGRESSLVLTAVRTL